MIILLLLSVSAYLFLYFYSKNEQRKRLDKHRKDLLDSFRPSEFPDSEWFHDPAYRPEGRPLPKYTGRLRGRGSGR